MSMTGSVWGDLAITIFGAALAGITAKAFTPPAPPVARPALAPATGIPNPGTNPYEFAVWNQQAQAVQQVNSQAKLESAVRSQLELRERLHVEATRAISEAAKKGAAVDPDAVYKASYENAVRLGLLPEVGK
jgi:hypothetical protein